MEQTVVALSRALLARHESLATAESCTGGWVAKVCTDLAGSSGWFERGLVTYSNASKQELLDVSAQTLNQYGAVSEQTVHEMVRGILRHSHAQWGLAISGIAGPDGGSASKPIGTVWIAWAGPGGWLVKRSYWFDGERDEVRRQAVETALRVLCDRLREPT
ncbi:MAG: nicotinamide-nucleotide amidase [Gammaproteobacteria bacterium]|nr:MAG: nicotinamide-nucleotide amidase [Gammaproteobacteria bacterium]